MGRLVRDRSESLPLWAESVDIRPSRPTEDERAGTVFPPTAVLEFKLFCRPLFQE